MAVELEAAPGNSRREYTGGANQAVGIVKSLVNFREEDRGTMAVMAAAASSLIKEKGSCKGKRLDEPEIYYSVNTIGVLGELAADLGTTAYAFHDSEKKLAGRVRFEARTEDVPDKVWRALLEVAVASERSRFAYSLAALDQHLEWDADEFFKFILSAAGKGSVLNPDFFERAFDLIAEWGAIRGLVSGAAAVDEMPPRDSVVVIVGRLEIYD